MAVSRFLLFGVIGLTLLALSLVFPPVRREVRALVRPEPPAPITPLAVHLPPVDVVNTPIAGQPAAAVAAQPRIEAGSNPEAAAGDVGRAESGKTAVPAPIAGQAELAQIDVARVRATARPRQVVVGGRTYDAYIPAASKKAQAYRYSCELDAAWVILKTYGFDVSVDKMIGLVGVDTRIEPYIEETKNGFVIHGGDITKYFSGSYKDNFLARSSGSAMRKVFEHFGLQTREVRDRPSVERALRAGQLVWMKTTVDFKPWRPAIWRMPDGRTHQTVLGNDHAVVVIGYNSKVVVIRDVLGPTSSNRQRPYEYEVTWAKFMATWEAQSFDALSVAPPSRTR